MAGEIFRLQTNIPVVGLLKYADYATSKEGDDQVRLTGDWVELGPEGEKPLGRGRFYLHLAVVGQLKDAGLIRERGRDKNGNPAYEVIGTPKIRIVRREYVEEGKKKTETTVTADGAPPAQTSNGPAPQGQPTPPASAPAPSTAPPANGAPKPDPKARAIAGWRRLGADYAMCAVISARSLAAAKNVKVADLDEKAIQAGVATLLIAAEKRGLDTFPGIAKHVLSDARGQRPADAAPPPRMPIPGQPAAVPAPATQPPAAEQPDFSDFDKVTGEDDDLPF